LPKPHPVGLASQCSRPVFAVDFTGIGADPLFRPAAELFAVNKPVGPGTRIESSELAEPAAQQAA
jgi:hypothetical protein